MSQYIYNFLLSIVYHFCCKILIFLIFFLILVLINLNLFLIKDNIKFFKIFPLHIFTPKLSSNKRSPKFFAKTFKFSSGVRKICGPVSKIKLFLFQDLHNPPTLEFFHYLTSHPCKSLQAVIKPVGPAPKINAEFFSYYFSYYMIILNYL